MPKSSNSQEYLYSDLNGPNTDHPDSMIRIGSAVNYFGVPLMGGNLKNPLSFAKSFSTVGQAPATRKLLNLADDSRRRLQEGLDAKKVSAERVVEDSQRYIPQIHSILLSCKVQPEAARLDEKLKFEWKSGVELKKSKSKFFSSEAIMYDLTMAVVSQGLGKAIAATDASIAGDFAKGAREYAAAAGIFDFLAKDHLPKWIAKGSNVNQEDLPSECHAPLAQALSQLFQANGQQMAVATVLMKPDKPNYGLLAKLCLGISESLEEFMTTLRNKASDQMARMDPDFFTMVTFQINVQKSLSVYFQARNLWEEDEHGLAIALLSESTVAARTRDSSGSAGLPDVSRTAALFPLKDDLQDMRGHMQWLLGEWEKENSSVYFAAVPQKVPAGKKLQQGLQMKRMQEYKLDDVDPILLMLPDGNPPPTPPAMTRSDSALARELQAKLNAGEDI